jgi:hypothetical protein
MARRHPSAQKKGKSHIGDPHSKTTNDRMKRKLRLPNERGGEQEVKERDVLKVIEVKGYHVIK